MASVVHIFVAPERGAPMEPREAAVAVEGKGLEGDRYAEPDHRRSRDEEVTLIEIENIEDFNRRLDLPLRPDQPRRNLVTRGVRLNELEGRRFRVGEVELEGVDLCEPCSKFARKTHQEALAFFVGKGGLQARIVKGGTIRVGDAVEA